jgi:hypothetical protein
MVLITPAKFGCNPTSSLTCEGRTSLLLTDGQRMDNQRTDSKGKKKYASKKILGDIIIYVCNTYSTYVLS